MLIIDEAGMVWVALRKESVDRNLFAGGVVGIIGRRSPQGERG